MRPGTAVGKACERHVPPTPGLVEGDSDGGGGGAGKLKLSEDNVGDVRNCQK